MSENTTIEDKLKREPIIKNLTKVLDSINLENGSVIGIDSPWGTGKTTFLILWEKYLKDNRKDDYSVSYFNVWENDDSGSPLISLLIKFESIFTDLGEKEEVRKEVKSLLKSLNVGFGFVSLDIGKFIESNKTSKLTEAQKAIENINNRIYETEKRRIGIKNDFKKALGELQKSVGKKIIIFIDELDRCRANFAIETLEIIKHIFNIENIIFILAWDKTQLSHSICNVYGNDMDSVGYLRRFIDLDYTLPEPGREDYLKYLIEKKELNDKYYPEFFHILEKLLGIYEMSLRDIDKLVFYLEVHIENIENIEGDFSDEIMREIYSLVKAVFICLKLKNTRLYNDLITIKYKHSQELLEKLMIEMRIGSIINEIETADLSFDSKAINRIFEKIFVYPCLSKIEKIKSLLIEESKWGNMLRTGAFFYEESGKNLIFEEIEFLSNFKQS